ncbi:hypothetical protein [Brucella anthropi]|uniref:hypothetical protein n=1 Tax=Brucella anthropi TaxID=529 RepID=UPI00384DE9D1
MAKHNNKGRSKGGAPYVQLFHWIRKTDAWRSLSPYPKLLYIEIRGRYNGSNNGGISFSVREAMDALCCSNRTAINAFKDLEDRGLIKAVIKGAFDWKTRYGAEGRATTWLLTELQQDVPERSLVPSYDFKKWVAPDGAKKKTRVKNIHPLGEKTTPMNDGMGEKNSPNGCKKLTDNEPFRTVDGCKKLTTYNLPYNPSKTSKPSSGLTQISDALIQSRLVSGNKLAGGGI